MEQLPLKVNWRITSKCNQTDKCKFCYSPTVPDIGKDERMIIAKRIIERGCKVIVITGGEPFMIKELPEIIKLFKQNSVFVNLSTNGNTLLRDFPDFYKYVDILALPLDSAHEDVHNGLRNSRTNYKNVIAVLEHIKENEIKKQYGLKLKIGTVLCKSNLNDLRNIAEKVKLYDADVWKIFEYNHYPDRSNNNEFVKNQKSIFNETNIRKAIKIPLDKTKLHCANSVSRDNRYFMINPDGNVVLPQKNTNNTFVDEQIGSLLPEIDNTIKKWLEKVDKERYNKHLKSMYDDTYKKLLYPNSDSKIVLENEDDILLWESIISSGLNRVYTSRSDFEKYRKYKGKRYDSLTDYISLAKKSVLIITNSLREGQDAELERFLVNKLKTDIGFSFTLILPDLNSKMAKVIAESRHNPNFKLLKERVKHTAEAILSIKKKANNTERLRLKYIDRLTYGSVIILDEEIMQMETKFYGVAEESNLILEFRKKDGSRGYFDAVYESVDRLLKGKGIGKTKDWEKMGKNTGKFGMGLIKGFFGIGNNV
ncbi:MAG: radical SAM protein [Bacteroidetes bacterium]|nr:radical SAM protein [Bacteroidota bacterium]